MNLSFRFNKNSNIINFIEGKSFHQTKITSDNKNKSKHSERNWGRYKTKIIKYISKIYVKILFRNFTLGIDYKLNFYNYF